MEMSIKAINKIRGMNKSSICLEIAKGGCVKYKYVFSVQQLDQCEYVALEVYEDDEGKVTVLVPRDQLEELESAKIDYKSDLVSAEFFVAENEYFAKNCGCGISVG